MNGINPYPPGHKYNPARNNETIRNLDAADVSRNANEMRRHTNEQNSEEEKEWDHSRNDDEEIG